MTLKSCVARSALEMVANITALYWQLAFVHWWFGCWLLLDKRLKYHATKITHKKSRGKLMACE